MVSRRVLISREDYARATRAGRLAERSEPRAASATYSARNAALEIVLRNGAMLTLPVRLIPWLRDVAPQILRDVEVLGRGGGLHWEALDLDLSVPALVASALEGPHWMAELGRSGGRRSSPAKVAAARRNGAKGGRPRKSAARGVGAGRVPGGRRGKVAPG
jgi:hypothetical protein